MKNAFVEIQNETNLLKKVGKPIKTHQYLLMAKLNTRNDKYL